MDCFMTLDVLGRHREMPRRGQVREALGRWWAECNQPGTVGYVDPKYLGALYLDPDGEIRRERIANRWHRRPWESELRSAARLEKALGRADLRALRVRWYVWLHNWLGCNCRAYRFLALATERVHGLSYAQQFEGLDEEF